MPIKLLQALIFVTLAGPYSLRKLKTKLLGLETLPARFMLSMMWDLAEPASPEDYEAKLRKWHAADIALKRASGIQVADERFPLELFNLD